MVVDRWFVDCESGSCVPHDLGDYVLYEDYIAEVERLKLLLGESLSMILEMDKRNAFDSDYRDHEFAKKHIIRVLSDELGVKDEWF